MDLYDDLHGPDADWAIGVIEADRTKASDVARNGLAWKSGAEASGIAACEWRVVSIKTCHRL